MEPRLSKKAVAKFWKTFKRQKNGCWLWPTSIENSYGSFSAENQVYAVHRLAWALANGPVPRGLSVLHKCDVRNCGNPEHLFTGTQKENVQDMHAKGRAKKSANLYDVHVHLFADDLAQIKKIAVEKGIPWSVELRSMVRLALKGERREITVVKEAS